MKKEQIKSWGLLGLSLLILLYCGRMYLLNGFTLPFISTLPPAMAAVPALVLSGYRRIGTLPALATLVTGLPVLYFAAGDLATALLVWALCCGTPLAVSLFWAYFGRIKPLTVYALPTAGLLWLGGAFLYSKLHLGSWSLYAITERMALRISDLLDQYEEFYQTAYKQLYSADLQKYLDEILTFYRSQTENMGFLLIVLIAYALIGFYFLGVFIADHSIPKDGRWLGNWKALIPGRGISFLYMGSYLLVLLLPEAHYPALSAVFNLFGFFYVFTALYHLLQLMRRKSIPPVACGLVIGLGFILSYLTAGGALLSPYSVLMYIGWWIATMPRIRQKKS